VPTMVSEASPNEEDSVEHFPCSIKREIGHLCHDERRPKPSEKPVTQPAVVPAATPQPSQQLPVGSYAPLTVYPTPTASIEASTWPQLASAVAAQPTFMYQPETFGNEFSVLT
jgi:hypothetical protein